MHRKCEQYLNRIPDYIDGSLPANKRAEMEKHLAGCKYCKNELETQNKWLANSFLNQEDAELAPEDKQRLQEQIMATIRSNEQSNRAAAYINEYKSKSEVQDGVLVGSSSSPQIDSIEKNKNSRDRKLWRRLPVLAGYAAVLLLVFITALLVRNLNLPDSNNNLVDKAERNLINDSGMEFESAEGDLIIDAYSDDSATLPMITSEAMGAQSVDETFAAAVENDGSIDSGEFSADKWSSFNGRLGELPLDPELFSESEAFEAEGVFNSSKALRILITQSSEQTTTDTPGNAPDISVDESEIETTATTTQVTVNKPQTSVGNVLILTAWNSWDVDAAADNLKYQLQENESEYDIIILDDSTGIDKIEAMIGPDETKAWKEQISTQKLDDLVWLALIAK